MSKDRRGNEGYLYLIEFDQGTFKVGFTKNPKSRIRSHRSNAEVFGIQILDSWISGPHLEASHNESLAIGWCRKHSSSVTKNEWFTGLEFKSVQNYLESLPSSRVTDEQIEREEEKSARVGFELTRTLMASTSSLRGELSSDRSYDVHSVAELFCTTMRVATWILENDRTYAELKKHLLNFENAYRKDGGKNFILSGEIENLRTRVWEIAEEESFDTSPLFGIDLDSNE